ncbi:GMC family oxidoreductase [Pseudomonas sp. S2_B12]
MSHPHYDYIIVGGGSAGSVIANRLSARADKRVLLIEAGADTPEHGTPTEILDGLQPWLPRLAGERFFWPGLTILRASEHPDIPREAQWYEQGRILGGGSSVNMMVANRGLPRDYDEWAARGADGWDWQGVLPYFRKLERDLDFGQSDPEQHGHDGPLPIARVDSRRWGPFTRASAHALQSVGLNNIVDQNGRFEDGYFAPAVAIEHDQRVSSARAYLGSAVRARSNLNLWTDTPARQLILHDNRVTGVQVLRDGQLLDVLGTEVILTAGALQTPALLLHAGIGPAAPLRDLGIEVVADRPGVGQNLWDHSSIGLTATLHDPLAPIDEPGAAHLLAARVSSGVDARVPADLYLGIAPNAALGTVGAVLWVNKPSSTGHLRLRSSDPTQYPAVEFNLLSDRRDLDRLREGLRVLAQVFADPAVTAFSGPPRLCRFAQAATEGPLLSELLANDAALERYLRTHVGGVWHASGTCRIGRADDPLAVVDAQGRVYGVHGLRVADASVMPSIPTANTNLPTVMIAEKIADAILADA